MSKKSPQLRFECFTDDWEERKLGKVLKKDTLKNKDLEFHYKDIISVAQMKKATVVRDSSDSYMTTYNKIRFGNIAFEGHANKEFPNGRFVLNDFRDGIVSHIYDVYSFIEKSDSNFMKKYINNPIVMRKILINSTSNARMMNSLNSKEFLKQNLILPTFEEQAKIGSFLKQLDITITLHQRKLDLLKEQKKGFLQKMFPKNGAKVPELRFKGFTEDWKERKVSEITDSHKQGFYTKESYNENKKYYLLRGTDMTSNKLILKDTPKINASEKDYEDFKVLKDDFLIVRSGTVGTYAIVKSDITAIFGSYLINFRFNQSIVLNEFFGLFYQSSLFKSQLNKIIQKSSNVNINAENIKSTNIKFPTIEEQQKIGDYFSNLDEIISLHQRKLDLLKEQKKGFLQKMFV